MSLTVNLHEAKTHLSRLVEQAAKGREFVIAKAGKPMVRVVPIKAISPVRTLGFLAGQGVAVARDAPGLQPGHAVGGGDQDIPGSS